MLKNKENSSLPPLVLADFADGSWHATSFAMSFLWEKKHPFYILQTFKTPDWGRYMPRRLSDKLKEITIHELQQLKHKLIKSYKIENKEVKTLSIEGGLNSVLQVKKDYYVVLGTYSSFANSATMQNRCLEKIINTSNHPLFIVPNEFEDSTNKELLFVANQSEAPSEQLVEKITNICKTTNSELKILFIKNKKNQTVPEKILKEYPKLFTEIKITTNQIEHTSKYKGIKKYLKNNSSDLIIIDN